MAKPGKVGLERVMNASRYSYQGLRAQWRYEAAFRQEVWLFLVAVPLAGWVMLETIEVGTGMALVNHDA